MNVTCGDPREAFPSGDWPPATASPPFSTVMAFGFPPISGRKSWCAKRQRRQSLASVPVLITFRMHCPDDLGPKSNGCAIFWR